MRSDAITKPSGRKKAKKQIKKMMNLWQTRGLIPADDQPGPTKAHRKAVIEYENEVYLQQQNARMKAGRSSWYGSEKTVMNKAEKRKTRVTSLVLHLKYASQGLTDSICVVQAADLPVKENIAEKTEEAPVIQTPKLYLSLTEVPPPSSIQAPNVGVLGGVLELDGVPTARMSKNWSMR
ncbi:hypothetical protein NQZ68_026303 [Dissostichus eleginoides]|nr:hypothetical protein NQZ68_026303 [Dissostichus eleginoides]